MLEKCTVLPLRLCGGCGHIPSSIEHDQLEPTVSKILHHIGATISGDKIKACHQLGKNSDKTIVKLSSRKDCEHVMHVKKDLKHLDATDLHLPAGTKLYINDSLFPHYGGLWNETKKLWNQNKNILLLMVLLG